MTGSEARNTCLSILVVLASCCAASCGRASGPGAARRVAPRLVGRFDRSSPAGPRFAWSGSTVEARFRGRSIAVRLRTAPLAPHAVRQSGEPVWLEEKTQTYAVTLDGRLVAPLSVGGAVERYVLVEGLEPRAVHEVAITRDVEALAGVHQLLGFEVTGGELLAPRERAHAIEVVGDSIACGYGLLGADATCPFTFATERASLAYPAIVGRELDVDVMTVCWSGRGVSRNFDGSTSRTMPDLFELALPEGEGEGVRFDFAAAREPDVVIVALGTNDFLGGREALDVASFEAGYLRFLARVRAVRPRAWLLVAESPMLPPEELDSRPGDVRALAGASLARIVGARRSAGDVRVELLPMPYQGARVGCDHHPNAAVHRDLARLLSSAIRPKLGL